ncbi:hypothetical protein BaRGS_00002679, partial [Batillaria attramentaria]
VLETKATLTRKNVEQLTEQEIISLQSYLSKLEDDHTDTGFQKLAAYHGEPSMCEKNGQKIACCIHGMANFPQWHRLYVVQFEQLLHSLGMSIGVPYWDTTVPLTHLPHLVEEQIFRDPNGGRGKRNAWFSGAIDIGDEHEHTARAVDPRLFEHVEEGQNTQLFNIILDALEQDSYCQFEVQFEVAHNHIHYLVGGRHHFSMSTLEYTAYDPIFFLHHSNMDRIFVVWQQLQKMRGKPYDRADCSVELFRWKMWPFSWDSNPVQLSRTYSQANSLWNHMQLEYWYDELNLNGMDLDELHHVIEERRHKERAFASFSLHGLGFSANVRVQVCGRPDDESHPKDPRRHRRSTDDDHNGGYHCEFAGDFFLLGGANEMAWEFHWPYYFDVTDAAELYHVNGTELPEDLLPHPVGVHRPSTEQHDDVDVHGHRGPNTVVRKNVNVLTDEEVFELRQALSRFQNDTSVDGYQAVAEFHGLPARCPRPDAAVRYACCIHGMATFPHWHRLFVVQVEDELRARGLHFGVPYWDWSVPHAHVPALAADETYTDPHHPDYTMKNPFHDAAVAFANERTSRNVQPELSQDPAFGDHTDLFDGLLLAFEQTDFCDFEIQFEVVHNAPHFLVGGFTPYSLSTLHYSAFDPLFYLHHSNVDRLWAIWQELQILRGKPYKAHCANSLTHHALKPFGFAAPLNNNKKTYEHARPTDIYDYEKELDYTYDSLQFGGMTVKQLNHYIEERQSRERVFVGIELHNIGVSAWAKVYLNAPGGESFMVGRVAVLGGEKEMPWHFDRLFKLEITDALISMGLRYDDDFTLQNLRDALKALEEDTTNAGFSQIAAFHGEPRWCPSTSAEKKYACCLHGMAVFPHWHRLLTVQAENALRAHGFRDGLPYWDWTLPMTHLPQAVESETYLNQQTGETVHNPLYNGVADGHSTERAPRQELFEQPEFGHLTRIGEQVMLAFEQTDYCNFEIQFEVAHNYIHALVGGNKPYSMASLRYTTYDPIFYLHHSNTDRLWAIWQELQKYRGLPYNTANCALGSMRKPLQPFAQTSQVNPDPMTRDHATPFDIQNEVVKREAHERVFAGFMLHGIGQSALVVFDICTKSDVCTKAGEFYLLGDEYEMPWSFDRLFKYEITNQLHDLHLEPLDSYHIKYKVLDLDNREIGHDNFGSVVIEHTYGAGHHDRKSYEQELRASSHVRRNLADLTGGEIQSLKSALQKMEDDHSFEKIAQFHGYPGLCTHGGRSVGCCIHGMPQFPHWHRLYVEQVEHALLAHGSDVSVPYWDWTTPFHDLPDLFGKATYFDSRSQHMEPNPFFHSKITELNEYTTRDPQPELFDTNYFLDNTLLALEQTHFCDFEIQFEILHNMLHSWVGGRGKYSLSTLDFSAYDPLFFLYHANTDRIWAIWQALQSYRGLPWDRSDCALNHMRDSLQPFANAVENEDYLTLKYSHPNDVWDYSDHLEYHYDSLELNGWSIPELERFWRGRRVTTACSLASCCTTSGHRPTWRSSSARPREGGRNCDHPAGKFSLLGGEYEMPFSFDRNYKFDISEPVRKLGFHLDRKPDFELKIQIHSYNGSYLDPHLLDQPSIIFEPGHRKDEVHEEQSDQAHSGDALIRRNVWALSMLERRSLVLALKGLEEDHSADGFQSLASFHALPELCPEPTASHRFACCEHGSAVFPQWHRLYTVQFEEALRRHGSLVGIPYWDTTDAQMRLPFFFSEQTFHDPIDDKDIPNPWLGADIDFEKSHTEREVNMARLQAEGEHGYDTWTWEQVMLALEQENYCDFEVQFEMAHNAIHAWIGGTKVHSMAHLHYASYDPVFILHHSSMDRIFAIWQELQRLRGYDPNVADCALDIMHKPLKPFTFGSPYNLNPDTKRYSRPDDIFDYRSHFHYEYDDLELQGLNPAQLEDRIHQRKDHERVFAGFMLHGIGTSAHVEFDVCSESNVCTAAGDFNILGGSAEMPWKFDRVYKYDITGVLNKKHIDPRDHFTFKLKITALNGTVLDSHLFPEPDVIIQPAAEEQGKYDMPANHIRHSLSDLNERDILSLKSSLNDLQHDEGKLGWQSLASYHGVPALCPTPEKAEYACCIHGMPTFPHWHRLYTLAVEHALNDHGSAIAIPYWDWTLPQEHLPEIFTEQTYYDAWKDEVFNNPFARGWVDEAQGRAVEDVKDGEHSVLFDEVLLALEQEDYCDFEVQFEELQRRRHKPADRADCAVNFMAQPMHPFDSVDLDPDANIRAHAYDNLDIGGKNLDELEELIHEHQAHDRVFAAFHLEGIGTSADVEFSVCEKHDESHRRRRRSTSDDCHRAGAFFILGGTKEMPWSFDRLYKYDITDALHEAHIEPEDLFDAHAPFYLEYEIHAVNGSALPKSVISRPTLVFEKGHASKPLLTVIQHDHGKGGWQAIGSTHGVPALCPTPEAAEFACCVHGMPTFPHWHRLYTLEVDRALIHHGSDVAIPYWDWTLPIDPPARRCDQADLPRPQAGQGPCPTRSPAATLLLALEQDDYCNFEVQFEVTHNAIHYLELQKRRHKPYNTADCAAKYMDEPMHPFDDPELDPDDFVRSHAVAHDAFDYHSLGYQYDNLDVGGKHIEEIEELIREHQSHPRVFAGFHLEGIGTSADVTFYVCKGEHDENDDCHRAGAFFILGGSKEMPWSFDRLYKYDITDVLHDMHIEPEDAIADHAPFHFDWVIHNVNGSTMPASTISAPRIMYAPSANKIRHNLNDLSSSDLASLEWALDKVQHDQGALGYQALAAYHGVPALCPTPEAAEFACCVHGMPTFPHWHRLYTLEVEHALLAQGSHVAIPYWDWTLAMDHLPEVLTRSTYFNEEHGRQEPNPFSHGYIAEAQEDTVRDPQPQLWKKSKDGEHSVLFDEVLLALEQEDYCDFEIQFEVTHNAIHYLVGGHNEHSLASLHYSGLRPRLFPAPLVR